MPNEKNLNRLNKLLEAFDSGAVQHDEMIQAIDAVIAIFNTEKTRVNSEMKKSEGDQLDALQKTKTFLEDKISGLKTVVAELKASTTQDLAVTDTRLSKEIKRVEAKIPTKTDLSGLESDIETLRGQLADIPTEITANPEAIRDSLELLQGDERLDKSAIKGIDELEELIKSAKRGDVKGIGTRFLRYLADVNIEGITNGQTLVWDSTTSKFEAGTGGGGYTNLTEFVDQTPHRIFYSDASGDVTELALGADGTFLKSNGATSAPSFAVPAGSGDVSKVGTPVNNQVGVWTGDGTIEGDVDLTFDTTTNTLAVGPVALDGRVQVHAIKGDASDGLLVEASNGTDVARLGVANTANSTFFGAVNIDGATRLATSLTGPLRADSGVVSVGTDNAGITRTVVVTSGSATAGSTALVDYVYIVSGAHTISLPAASGNSCLYTVKNNHSANITIDTVGSETIDGTASISIAPEESVNIISDGTNFNIV